LVEKGVFEREKLRPRKKGERREEYAYLGKPEKLQVEFAYSLVEGHRRAAIKYRREGGNILEKGRLLIVIPLDGPNG
jgi:hypothetical protein